jgi:hypothetical protein
MFIPAYVCLNAVIHLVEHIIRFPAEASSLYHAGVMVLAQCMNQSSILTHEFFQTQHVQDIFGIIRRYWIRREFASHCGHLHAHLLAFPDNQSISGLWFATLQFSQGRLFCAPNLAEWVEKGMKQITLVSGHFNSSDVHKSSSPPQIRFSGKTKKCAYRFQDLFKHVHIHKCSAFCMKTNEKFDM